MKEKRSNVCAFVNGHRTVSTKFFVLRVVLQRHVWLEEAIQQFFLLVLGSYAAQSSC